MSDKINARSAKRVTNSDIPMCRARNEVVQRTVDRVIMREIAGLRGELTVPGDKSVSHRAVMFASIAKGRAHITNFLQGADCIATMDCFRSMGVRIEHTSGIVTVHGKGLRGLRAPGGILNVGNSGTTTRLIAGILAGQDFSCTLSGDDSLNSRPMGRILEPLGRMGANITSTLGNNCAPLHIAPARLQGIAYTSPVASAQVKSAILLAGLYADSCTTITEPTLSRNHTELMLRQFGASVTSEFHSNGEAVASVKPCEELFSQDIIVPGDISSAAYFIAAGLLVPNSEILIKNVGTNPTRAGILRVCRDMGADITYLNENNSAAEPTADLLIKSSTLRGIVIEGNIIPTLIDEIPIIAVMAAFAEGTTVIRNAAELRVKETNRIDTVTENLRAMGCDITPTDDGMVIRGGAPLHGAHINSHLDHRIAMAFTIAGLCADGDTIIQDSQCVDVSYPEFFDTLGQISQKGHRNV